jgi:hypothetical protein
VRQQLRNSQEEEPTRGSAADRGVRPTMCVVSTIMSHTPAGVTMRLLNK